MKSTRDVHFIILPASPCTAEFYEIWHTRSTHRRNHMCQIFSQSKLPLPIDLQRRPYNSVRTAVRHCDTGTGLNVVSARNIIIVMKVFGEVVLVRFKILSHLCKSR